MSKRFDHPNTSNGWTCPYCGSDEDKPVILIPIAGTREGMNVQATQIHYDCLLINVFGESMIEILEVIREKERKRKDVNEKRD